MLGAAEQKNLTAGFKSINFKPAGLILLCIMLGDVYDGAYGDGMYGDGVHVKSETCICLYTTNIL
jgi:hypothetical protein